MGGAHAHARDLGLEGALERSIEVGNVGRGAAHVEADDPAEPRHPGRLDGPHDAAGRPRQNGVLALEQVGRREPAGRHHEHQARIAGARFGRDAEVLRHLGDVTAQDGAQVGVDHGRVAPADELHEPRGLVADRDLREHLAGDPGRPLFVGRMVPAVHEDDRDGAVTVAAKRLEKRPHRVFIERALDRSVGQHAFVDLLDPRIEQLGQHDPLGEDVGPGLVADAQRITKPACDEERRAFALALQQRVGGDRRSHLDRAHEAGRQGGAGRHVEAAADRFHRGVAIRSRVFAQQLRGVDPPGRVTRHDVREGAAAVDPEIPKWHGRSPLSDHDVRRPGRSGQSSRCAGRLTVGQSPVPDPHSC